MVPGRYRAVRYTMMRAATRRAGDECRPGAVPGYDPRPFLP